jgi:hypothetical protein
MPADVMSRSPRDGVVSDTSIDEVVTWPGMNSVVSAIGHHSVPTPLGTDKIAILPTSESLRAEGAKENVLIGGADHNLDVPQVLESVRNENPAQSKVEVYSADRSRKGNNVSTGTSPCTILAFSRMDEVASVTP